MPKKIITDKSEVHISEAPNSANAQLKRAIFRGKKKNIDKLTLALKKNLQRRKQIIPKQLEDHTTPHVWANPVMQEKNNTD